MGRIEIQNQPKTILIALDGSPTAKTASELAIYLAKGLHYGIKGLYIVDVDLVAEPFFMDKYLQAQQITGEWSTNTTAGLLHKQGEEALAWLEDMCLLEGIPFWLDVKRGDVSELLISEGDECELVTLGRRGLTHADDQDKLGRHFMTVASRLRKPVLVSGDKPTKHIRRLLVAYNRSEPSQNALHWSARIQHALDAEISILGIEELEGDPVESWLDHAQERLRAENAKAETFIHRGQIADEILAAAVEHRSDLILMGRRSFGSPFEWLIGSTADRVLHRTQLPVLLA
jgi:nucleotide-binding universal stress UspA family protein